MAQRTDTPRAPLRVIVLRSVATFSGLVLAQALAAGLVFAL